METGAPKTLILPLSENMLQRQREEASEKIKLICMHVPYTHQYLTHQYTRHENAHIQAEVEHVTRVFITYTLPPQICEIPCFVEVGMDRASGCHALYPDGQDSGNSPCGQQRPPPGVALGLLGQDTCIKIARTHARTTGTRTHRRGVSSHQHSIGPTRQLRVVLTKATY